MATPPRALDNSDIAELLAVASTTAKHPAQKALRRAARRAFLWPEQAADLLAQGRSLTELSGVGPFLEEVIRNLLEDPPDVPESPPERQGFLTVPDARAILASDPSWAAALRGDLQTHSEWSDGTAPIREMAEAAAQLGYEYLAITDHAQSLKIAGGMDERQLRHQWEDIEEVNGSLASLDA